MCFSRKIDVATCETFGEIFSSILPYVSSLCVYCNQIHAAFYSYIDGSVKDSKRCCRYKDCLIVFHTIVDSTPILVNMLTFWISNESKEKLQLLFIKHYLKNAKNGTVIKVHLSLMET